MPSKPGDPRLCDLLDAPANEQNQTGSDEQKQKRLVVLLGYPCDEGVARNGGCIGAKAGPASVRKILPKLGTLSNPEYNVDIRNLLFSDLGDIDVVDNNLEQTHKNLIAKVSGAISGSDVAIVVGGGNDQSYGNAKSLMNIIGNGNIGVVNIDAHLDVRPLLLPDNLPHSGSPFRQLLEDKQFQGVFHEFAVQGAQCSKEHADYILSKQGTAIHWLSRVEHDGAHTAFAKILESFGKRPAFISFDIDSIRGCDAPGVSCQSVVGLTAQNALDICVAAGAHPHTRLLDISEYNPAVEEPRTARLVAMMIYHFLMGVAIRAPKEEDKE